MNPKSSRWNAITKSAFDHERKALEWVRRELPDHEPWRAWSNFEFVGDDGSMNEVDLMVLSPVGLYLVEIKSWRGHVRGDSGTWKRRFDGKDLVVDNPLLLANRKAKRLKSKLVRQPSLQGQWLPFVEPVIFLSATDLQVELDPDGRKGIFGRDDHGEHSGLPGFLAHLKGETAKRQEGAGFAAGHPRRDRRIRARLAHDLEKAMEGAGIRASQRHRKVGDYTLEELLYDGEFYQDWRAGHGGFDEGYKRRIRIYVTANARGSQERQALERAARREFLILQGIDHPGVLGAREYKEHERGPAVLFDHYADAMRLDHVLAEGPALSIEARLHLLRELAETLRFAHGKRLYHRALSPQSILLRDPGSSTPQPVVFNWQTGVREASTTEGGGRRVSATAHPDRLVESAASGYMAPEVRLGSDADGAAADLFSLGALTFHLFAGRPAAESHLELVEILRSQGALRLSAATDGVPPGLEELVAEATSPVVSERLATASDFLAGLDIVWDELTRPEDEAAEELVSPEVARRGDALGDGWTVKKRLGQGATSYAFLARRGEEGPERVLKIARTPEHDATLEDEAEVLRQLRHQHVVEIYDDVRLAGRRALVLARAGETTLAQRLRADGRLSLDLLQRWGEDLLSTVAWLEQKGIAHRDLKPENLGIQKVGKKNVLRLVLFDFSLSRAPMEDIRAGTAPYLDPFLPLRAEAGGTPRWDLAAERFAAAVTLYEMATGRLPGWGDGQTDPQFLDDEVSLASEHFYSSVRAPLQGFFARALRRDARRRFDNAEAMLRDWRKVFETAHEPVVPAPVSEGAPKPLDLVQPESQVIELQLSKRAFHALENLGVETVADLLHPKVELGNLTHMRGVGAKTRDEIVDAARYLRARFAASAPEDERPEAESEPKTAPEPETAPGLDDLPALADLLLPKSRKGSARATATLLLGWPPDEAGDDASAELGTWPTQSEVARALDLTRARIGQLLTRQRKRWGEMPALDAVRDEIHARLGGQGGVMTAAEAAESLAGDAAAEAKTDEERRRHGLAGRAVLRAAWETESAAESPRWVPRRRGDLLLLALDGGTGDEADEPPASALADWARALGEEADRLAERDPLPAAATVVEALRAVEPPAGATGSVSISASVSSSRLMRLAAACSERAAVSGRLELYPRGLSARRALRLAGGVVTASTGEYLLAEELIERVAARYPEAERLPGRPELDTLLEQEGFEVDWIKDAEVERGDVTHHGAYRLLGLSGLPSSTATASQLARPPIPQVSREELQSDEFDERLARHRREGGVLLLLADPRFVGEAEEALLGRFPGEEVRQGADGDGAGAALDEVNLDALFLRHLRSEADRIGLARWEVVLEADAAPPGSRDRDRLQSLVDGALPRLEEDLLGHAGSVLLTQPGLLTRYDRLDLIEGLRHTLSRPPDPEDDRRLRSLWILVPADEQAHRPRLDGRAIPVISESDWARIPHSWLRSHSLSHSMEATS